MANISTETSESRQMRAVLLVAKYMLDLQRTINAQECEAKYLAELKSLHD
jgi:hypothetical protein